LTVQTYGANIYVSTRDCVESCALAYASTVSMKRETIMIISERIFKILEDKNMSQNAFAKQVGLASSTISDWKTKKTNPSADKIMDICMVLEVTPEQLLTGKGIDEDYVEYNLKATKSAPEISKADMRIIEDIHAMKDVQRKRLMKYMEALKQIEKLEEME